MNADENFWDLFHDECFPNDPYMRGRVLAEIERMKLIDDRPMMGPPPMVAGDRQTDADRLWPGGPFLRPRKKS